MSEIIIENLPDEVSKATISFEENPITEEFDELPIKDAEIVSETPLTKVKTAEKEEEPDDFTKFLLTLPEDSNPAIIITRQPDRNYAGQFRIACESQEHTGTLNWNNYTDPSEIYNDIAKKFGGGRYSIQVKDGQRFEKHRTWTTTIGDPVQMSEKEKTLLELKTKNEEQPRNVESSPVFANAPQAEPEKKNFLREAMEQIKDLKEFQNLLAPPTQPASDPTAQPIITKETIKMALIEKALNNENLVEKAIEAVFDIAPEAEEKSSNTIIEVIRFAASHQTEAKAVLDMAFSGVGVLLSNLMPKPPPVNIPTNIIPSGLQRFKRQPDTPTYSPMPETAPQVESEPENNNAPVVHIPEIEPFPFIALEG